MEYDQPTELNDDLAKIVRMPGPRKEALVADCSLVVLRTKPVLLRVADGFHYKPDREEHNASNVPAGAERVLHVHLHGGRVENGDGQRDGPDPDHLEDPKAQEREELVAFVVEAVVFARLDDAEQQEG